MKLDLERKRYKRVINTINYRLLKERYDNRHGVSSFSYLTDAINGLSKKTFSKRMNSYLYIIQDSFFNGEINKKERNELIKNLDKNRTEKNTPIVDIESYYRMGERMLDFIISDINKEHTMAYVAIPLLVGSKLSECLDLKYEDVEFCNNSDGSIVIFYKDKKHLRHVYIAQRAARVFIPIFNALTEKYGADANIFYKKTSKTWDMSKNSKCLFDCLRGYFLVDYLVPSTFLSSLNIMIRGENNNFPFKAMPSG